MRVTVVHVEITRQGRCEAFRCRSSQRKPSLHAPHSVSWPHTDSPNPRHHRHERGVQAGWGRGGRMVRGDCPRSRGRHMGVIFHLSLRPWFSPPLKRYQQHASALHHSWANTLTCRVPVRLTKVGARMSSYAWLCVVLAVWAGRLTTRRHTRPLNTVLWVTFGPWPRWPPWPPSWPTS